MEVKIAQSLNSTITLKDGVVIPMFGLGMFKSGSVLIWFYQYEANFDNVDNVRTICKAGNMIIKDRTGAQFI